MGGQEEIAFPEIPPAELEAYVRSSAANIGLSIPGACLPAVMDNLASLQAYAAILAAALQAAEPQTPSAVTS